MRSFQFMFGTCVCVSLKIESETTRKEKILKDAAQRLGSLGLEINALKTKRANNSMAAARAEETATMARDKAIEAKQVCVCAHAQKLPMSPAINSSSSFCLPLSVSHLGIV